MASVSAGRPVGSEGPVFFKVAASACSNGVVNDSDIPSCRYWWESDMDCKGCLDNGYRAVEVVSQIATELG